MLHRLDDVIADVAGNALATLVEQQRRAGLDPLCASQVHVFGQGGVSSGAVQRASIFLGTLPNT